MKKNILLLALLFSIQFLFAVDEIKNEKANIVLNKQGIEGYVLFKGFDFVDYNHEDRENYPPLQDMLDLTYEELVKLYKKGKKPFVFVGYSQGGLRAIAMTSYLKQKDPTLYKKLKGVITVSGIDTGLKFLENRGAQTRERLREDVKTLNNGVVAAKRATQFVLPGVPLLVLNPDAVTSNLFGLLDNTISNEVVYNLGVFIFADCCSLSKEFLHPVLTNSDWDSYEQVRDMCPGSEFIEKYKLNVKNVKKDNKAFEFRIGLNSDPVKLVCNFIDDKNEINTDEVFTVAGGIFRTAQVIHIAAVASGVGLFTNSIMHAANAEKAVKWCDNYESEMKELISGGEDNDGLVAKSNQYIVGLGNTVEYKNENHSSIWSNEDIWEQKDDIDEEKRLNQGMYSIERTVRNLLGIEK